MAAFHPPGPSLHPKSPSWRNSVGVLLRQLTNGRIEARRLHIVVDLQAATIASSSNTMPNQNPIQFSADPEKIIQRVQTWAPPQITYVI